MRERVGLTECSNFAKYKVSGAGSADWLQGLFTNRLPKVGRIALTAMLNPQGRIVGEFSVARVGDDEFFLFGSQAAEVYHSRWFLDHLPSDSAIRFEVLALSLVGVSVAGPHARDVLQSATAESLATADFPFMSFRHIDVGMIPAWVGRMSYTGDLGYEIWVAPEHQRALFDVLWHAGQPYGMALFGFRALMSMRMEKMFGTWYREYRPIYTPLEAGMDRYLKLDHDFVGRAALEAEMARGPERRMVYLEVDPDPDEPGRRDRRRTDLARRRGGRMGDVGCVRPLQRRVAGTRLRPGGARDPGGRRGRRSRDRDHRAPTSGPSAQRAGPRSERSTNACVMGRLVDVRRRTELLDDVVAYLAEHGIAGLSLRPMAKSLSVSVNALVHHFGTKDEIVVAALRRAVDVQEQVQARWTTRNPGLSQAELLRRWWRWINSSPANLDLVRLGLEAAALDATATGLPGPVRADQIGLWRSNIEQRLIAEGVQGDVAAVEASLVKAMFTGLVVDLLATGERRRLTRALEVGLARLDQVVWANAGLSDPAIPASTRHRVR